jgi:transposase
MVTAIELSEDERRALQDFLHRGKANARTQTRARILLKCADTWSVQEIVEALETSPATIYNVCQRYREGGLDHVLHDKIQQNRRRALSGEAEALVIAITCSPVPDGHDHWTLRMVRDRLIELHVVEQIHHTTIRHVLKKTS